MNGLTAWKAAPEFRVSSDRYNHSRSDAYFSYNAHYENQFSRTGTDPATI
jgi:hypothetical protein